jgi:uncharacterized NAD(P)/FAD-binding protein YdhS
MNKSARLAAAPEVEPPSPPAEAPSLASLELVREFLSTQSARGRDLMAVQDELMRFFAERLQHNLDALSEMGRCVSPAEALEIHQRWMRDAALGYQAEMTRLFELGKRAMVPAEMPPAA